MTFQRFKKMDLCIFSTSCGWILNLTKYPCISRAQLIIFCTKLESEITKLPEPDCWNLNRVPIDRCCVIFSARVGSQSPNGTAAAFQVPT